MKKLLTSYTMLFLAMLCGQAHAGYVFKKSIPSVKVVTPEPAVSVSSPTISFGAVQSGNTSTQSVSLSNSGTGAANVSGILLPAGISLLLL